MPGAVAPLVGPLVSMVLAGGHPIMPLDETPKGGPWFASTWDTPWFIDADKWDGMAVEFAPDYSQAVLYPPAAEMQRSVGGVRYGQYRATLQPARGDGLVSSYFLYSDTTAHEIDIEFLGRDTSAVHFTVHVDGKVPFTTRYELGYDASRCTDCTYAISFDPLGVTWLVNDEPVVRWAGEAQPKGLLEDGVLVASVWQGLPQWAGRVGWDVEEAQYIVRD